MGLQKKIYLFFTLLLTVTFVNAQDKPASPAAIATGKINGANITIKYSSPSVKGRKIWGELVPFDKVWRAGANEATTFETDKDLIVEGLKLPAGKYSFFVIPNEKECILIFNKEANINQPFTLYQKKSITNDNALLINALYFISLKLEYSIFPKLKQRYCYLFCKPNFQHLNRHFFVLQ